MSEVIKLPLKKAEISLSKFNDVAIPHHLNLLKKHKENIIKQEALQDWDKIEKEQINATRVVQQLKQLLYEMQVLRNQILDSDLDRFDKLIEKSKLSTLLEIKKYLDFMPSMKKRIQKNSITDEEFSFVKVDDSTVGSTHVTQEINKALIELNQDEEVLKSFEDLQKEVEDLKDLFVELDATVNFQKENVEIVETNIIATQDNVKHSERILAKLAKMKRTMYPVAGAVLGGCIGGPVGILAGMKIGGIVAVSCGVLGFTGGKLLNKTEDLTIKRDKKD